MGCDIHFCVEVFNGTSWASADTWEIDEDKWRSNYDTAFCGGRNYNLFAILADVRNGRGFVGISTGEGFNPIAPPRGVPDDASPEYQEFVEQWDGDGHSHSYFTVSELLKYDWTQTAKQWGFVSCMEYFRWNKTKNWKPAPESYCGDVYGNFVKKISPEEMDRLLDGAKTEQDAERVSDQNPSTYTLIQWEQSYSDCCSNLNTMPELWKLGDPDKVRILFFFDN